MRVKRYLDVLKYYVAIFNNPIAIAAQGLNFLKYATLPKGSYCHNLPISAQIEPTLRCNLKCTMCVREHFKQGDMSFEDFRNITSQMKGLVKIHLQGLGEPFLNKDLFHMIHYAHSRCILVSIITNGTMLNAPLIQKIAESNVFELGISIDAVDKKSYEAIRVGANFERVLDGVKGLSSALKENKSPTNLFLAVTILRSNLHMMPDFIRLAKGVGINRIVFQRVQTKDDFVNYYKSDFRNSKEFVSCEEVMREFEKIKPFADSSDIRVLFEEKKVGCLWPWRSLYVTWSGNITPCCMIVDPKSLPLGNVIKTPFNVIWNSKPYRLFRKSILNKKPLAACAGCRAISYF